MIDAELDNYLKAEIRKARRYSPYTEELMQHIRDLTLRGGKRIRPATLEKLSRYTVPLGIAFQIQDDILGMFGREEILGKPAVSDLREGKKTLLIVDALANSDGRQKTGLRAHLGNPRAGAEALKAVQKILVDTGAREKSQALTHRLAGQAVDALQQIRLKKTGKAFRLNIAEYVIKRDY